MHSSLQPIVPFDLEIKRTARKAKKQRKEQELVEESKGVNSVSKDLTDGMA